VCRHEETGLLVPLKESAPLADALQTLAEDPALRARYGEAARALTESAFSESVIVSQTIKLYESVMPS
jgi:glycosyltransferase involved in cell wall biosynthesis